MSWSIEGSADWGDVVQPQIHNASLPTSARGEFRSWQFGAVIVCSCR